MPLYNRRRAAHFLKSRVHYQDPTIKMSARFLKQLETDCRLIPEHHGVFGNCYTEKQLIKYAHEIRPH